MRAPVGVQGPATGGVPSAGRLDTGGPSGWRTESGGPAACRTRGAPAGRRERRGSGGRPAGVQEQERGQRGKARVHGGRAGGEGPAVQELQPGGGAGVAGTATRSDSPARGGVACDGLDLAVHSNDDREDGEDGMPRHRRGRAAPLPRLDYRGKLGVFDDIEAAGAAGPGDTRGRLRPQRPVRRPLPPPARRGGAARAARPRRRLTAPPPRPDLAVDSKR